MFQLLVNGELSNSEAKQFIISNSFQGVMLETWHAYKRCLILRWSFVLCFAFVCLFFCFSLMFSCCFSLAFSCFLFVYLVGLLLLLLFFVCCFLGGELVLLLLFSFIGGYLLFFVVVLL